MQAAQQTTVVCPRPTDAQVASQVSNMRWQEHEASVQNAFNRQQQQVQAGIQQRQMQIEHEHYMVTHLTEPLMILCLIIVFGLVMSHITRIITAAGVEKNRDDNAADVNQARATLDKAAEQ